MLIVLMVKMTPPTLLGLIEPTLMMIFYLKTLDSAFLDGSTSCDASLLATLLLNLHLMLLIVGRTLPR